MKFNVGAEIELLTWHMALRFYLFEWRWFRSFVPPWHHYPAWRHRRGYWWLILGVGPFRFTLARRGDAPEGVP